MTTGQDQEQATEQATELARELLRPLTPKEQRIADRATAAALHLLRQWHQRGPRR